MIFDKPGTVPSADVLDAAYTPMDMGIAASMT